MGEASNKARNGTLLSNILAGTVLLCGCADLALEADRIPKEMTLSPDTGMLTAGGADEAAFHCEGPERGGHAGSELGTTALERIGHGCRGDQPGRNADG